MKGPCREAAVQTRAASPSQTCTAFRNKIISVAYSTWVFEGVCVVATIGIRVKNE